MLYPVELLAQSADMHVMHVPLDHVLDGRTAIRSGRPDSNRRPPAPKAGALTGLRYAPKYL